MPMHDHHHDVLPPKHDYHRSRVKPPRHATIEDPLEDMRSPNWSLNRNRECTITFCRPNFDQNFNMWRIPTSKCRTTSGEQIGVQIWAHDFEDLGRPLFHIPRHCQEASTSRTPRHQNKQTTNNNRSPPATTHHTTTLNRTTTNKNMASPSKETAAKKQTSHQQQSPNNHIDTTPPANTPPAENKP